MNAIKTFFHCLLCTLCLIVQTGCSDREGDGEPQYRYEATLRVGGRVRAYVVKLPKTYYDSDSNIPQHPLVIALHGTGGSARQMEATYGLNEKADKEAFVVAYPEGVRSSGALGIRTWNAGTCCDYAMENNVDDVGFIRELITHLTSEFTINPKRIYVTGMSNGGMMAYRLACELADKIAAIAPVSSTMMATRCEPARTLPILHIHSLLDTKVPYSGGIGIGGYNFSSVDSILNTWVVKDKCNGDPSTIDNGRYKVTTWDCEGVNTIESYVTYDGGHSWPGGIRPTQVADPPSTYINATDLLWDFFKRFELP